MLTRSRNGLKSWVRKRRVGAREWTAVGFGRHTLLAVVLVILLALGLVSGCSDHGLDLEEVQLDSGPISGVLQDGAWSFKGIPYAASPVGEFRWKPPRPVVPWEETRACIEFGPACPQPAQSETFYLSVGETSEDCLYLNVWAPSEPVDGGAAGGAPAMVWIHGGSFETGAGSMSVYDGTKLAKKGVVVVTINYRLGPLGFLAHPALSNESPQEISGNYGLLDQVAALEWVQKNITAFGGDPANVTVFGESAGAISILDLLVSPVADGLFQKAIVQSGILLDRGFGVSTNGTLEDAEQAGVAFAERLGIPESSAPMGGSTAADVEAADAEMAAALRAKTPQELLDASAPQQSVMEQGLRWKPVVDGFVLPDLPTTLWADGRIHPMPLLIGSNKDEGNLFLQGLTLEPAEFEAQMQAVFGPFAGEASALYPVDSPEDITTAFSRMLTEVGFASTARFAARAMSTVSNSTTGATAGGAASGSAFLYHFTRVPFDNPLGAFHGVEVPYVFGNTEMFEALGAIADADRELSTAIMDYWTTFARTGDPTGSGSVVWPAYEPASDFHLELGDNIAQGSGLYKEACDLGDEVRGLR